MNPKQLWHIAYRAARTRYGVVWCHHNCMALYLMALEVVAGVSAGVDFLKLQKQKYYEW